MGRSGPPPNHMLDALIYGLGVQDHQLGNILGGITTNQAQTPGPGSSLTIADLQRAQDLLTQIGYLNHDRHRQAAAQIYGDPFGQPGARLSAQPVHTLSGYPPHAFAAALAQAQARAPANLAELTEPPEDTGIEVGEIIAWRVWGVARGRLQSVHVSCEWEPGVTLEAHRVDHQHGGGIHAFKTREQTLNQYRSFPDCVLGRVKLWGQVVEFERGFHAEFAEVLSIDQDMGARLYGPLRGADAISVLRETYGVAENSEPEPEVRPDPSPVIDQQRRRRHQKSINIAFDVCLCVCSIIFGWALSLSGAL